MTARDRYTRMARWASVQNSAFAAEVNEALDEIDELRSSPVSVFTVVEPQADGRSQ